MFAVVSNDVSSLPRFLAVSCLALGSVFPGCEAADCATDSCNDRISVELEPERGPIPTGTYTFTMAPGTRPGIAAICSVPGPEGLESCEARGENLTLTAKSANNLIVLELLAPSGDLHGIETYDISVALDGKILIAETKSARFKPTSDDDACGQSTCQKAADALPLP
ncbi:MAG: hypothetical protein MUC50_18000 [Myxococcota bacterium]|nr:hypothetical protein [Myxococcota bacterium]